MSLRVYQCKYVLQCTLQTMGTKMYIPFFFLPSKFQQLLSKALNLSTIPDSEIRVVNVLGISINLTGKIFGVEYEQRLWILYGTLLTSRQSKVLFCRGCPHKLQGKTIVQSIRFDRLKHSFVEVKLLDLLGTYGDQHVIFLGSQYGRLGAIHESFEST